MKKHIVIFSHWFWVEKDSLWLFTEISEMLSSHNIQSIMFDYNTFSEDHKEVFVKPFSEQAKILQLVIDDTVKNNPNSTIDIIWHSQWSVMVWLCNIDGIRKIISMSPFFHTNIHEVIERHKKFPTSEINFNWISKRIRSDGTITIIPSEYRAERFATDVYDLYNKLALISDLTIIRPGEDQIMKNPDLLNIFNTPIINIHWDHDFKWDNRKWLIKILEKILTK